MHNWTLFKPTKVIRYYIKGKFLPYKLIGDCAYPVQPWNYSPFIGCLENLKGYKYNWIFIQSCSRICVEYPFEILKNMKDYYEKGLMYL